MDVRRAPAATWRARKPTTVRRGDPGSGVAHGLRQRRGVAFLQHRFPQRAPHRRWAPSLPLPPAQVCQIRRIRLDGLPLGGGLPVWGLRWAPRGGGGIGAAAGSSSSRSTREEATAWDSATAGWLRSAAVAVQRLQIWREEASVGPRSRSSNGGSRSGGCCRARCGNDGFVVELWLTSCYFFCFFLIDFRKQALCPLG